jgi:type I restriction enzyme, S subunit
MIELPRGWMSAEYGEVADIKLGKMLDKAKNKGQPTPYLRNINVRWGSFDLSDLSSMRMSSEERAALSIQNGDILVCEGGEPGRAAVWDQGPTDLTFQKALMRLRSRGEIDPQFLAAFLRLSYDSGQLERHFTGTTIKHLPQVALSRVVLPLAPATEQRRIVAKIDRLSASSRQARDHLDHLPRLVEKYKQAILAAAFRGDLTRGWRQRYHQSVSSNDLETLRASRWQSEHERGRLKGNYKPADAIDWQPTFDLPTGWVWASVDQVSYLIQYGSSAKTSDTGKGVAVLRMGNIQSGVIDVGSLKFLPDDHDEFPELILDDGDVLFNRTNSAELVGKTAVYQGKPKKASFASYLIRVRCCGLMPSLLSGYINSAVGREWIANVVNQQVGQANVNGTKLRQLGVPVMPHDEQVQIASRIHAAFAWIDRLAFEATSARKLIDHIDQAILAKGFRGELVPQDLSDEPASVLLELIKAERLSNARASKERKKTTPGRPKPALPSRESKSTASSKRSVAKRRKRTR